MLGEKTHNNHKKKKAENFFFGSVPWRNILGNTKSSSTVKCLSVYWFIWDLTLRRFPNHLGRRGCLFYFVFFPVWCFSLTATGDSRLVFVFFGMVELSSLSPPHGAQISALWRQVNVTKHGAICSTVMHHRLTARIKSALCWVHAPTACAVCTWGIFTPNETFR